jgi:nitric oxide reductase subunit B
MNTAMVGITFALLFAGILQTHLQRVMNLGYMQVQSQLELFYWLRLGSGVLFIVGALIFIYSVLGPNREAFVAGKFQHHNA